MNKLNLFSNALSLVNKLNEEAVDYRQGGLVWLQTAYIPESGFNLCKCLLIYVNAANLCKCTLVYVNIC